MNEVKPSSITEVTDLADWVRGSAIRNLNTSKFAIGEDYFSWGRDRRHMVDDSETLPDAPHGRVGGNFRSFAKALLRLAYRGKSWTSAARSADSVMNVFDKTYCAFNDSFQLMSDQYSRQLFADLVCMQVLSEKRARLSSFTQDFIDSYEEASSEILNSEDSLRVYRWILKRIDLQLPSVSFYTVPTILNLHKTNRLYRYQKDGIAIGVEGGDVLIDGGVGWGDTAVYLGAIANDDNRGHVYSFDILETGMDALAKQLAINPTLNCVSAHLLGLSDVSGETVNITEPGPGAHITAKDTGSSVQTISIDDFMAGERLSRVDMIKMDIEGAEVPALKGASSTIRKYKPKLAISAYHKWDDLLVIPQLIHSIRDDYSYYLDCTTGFGGEAILYCR
jgi:FkbM family methyltransferase